jgi:hypothetical protein
MRSSLARLLPALSCLALGCAGGGAPAPPTGVVLTTLAMHLDPAVPVGEEAYVCVGLDAGGAAGAAIHALRWTPPSGPVRIHHAMMFATADLAGVGAVPCDPMPSPAVVLTLYAPGGETTALADGVSIAVPAAAAGIFVQLHLLRFGAGADEARVDLLASEEPPVHLAGWVDDLAPVPQIPPQARVTATAQCHFPGPVHVVGSWPHMHRLGASFQGTIVRSGGGSDVLVDVPAWDFSHQLLYPVDADLAADDGVETSCTWTNTTPVAVSGGPLSSNEMCNQGLVVWPSDLAHCLR